MVRQTNERRGEGQKWQSRHGGQTTHSKERLEAEKLGYFPENSKSTLLSNLVEDYSKVIHNLS
jgi:hypothetical protein